MNYRNIALLMVALLAGTFSAAAQSVIVLPVEPTPMEQQTADELHHFLSWQVVREPLDRAADTAIFVGQTKQAVRVQRSDDRLAHDGFIVRSDGRSCVLVGPQGKGVLYAAYDLLEQMGFRYYTPSAVVIPASLRLPVCNRIENPSFEYREVLYYYPNHDQRYADWHHLHTRADLAADWGMFVHTFQHLVPAGRYFAGHPDWFSEINGHRVRDGQLCLSNPAVLEQLCKSLADSVRRHPDKQIWSVSNNDNYNACQCEECQLLDSLYGGPSGTLIHFINQVARRFPDKTISTLGYQFTRRAPRQDCPQPQQPDSNVNIMFCSIECGRQEAIATAPGEAGFRKDMEDWHALTDNIFMWDYVVQFRNFWDPFPNLHVLQPNLRYFHDNGVRKMFEQGTGADNKTSWMEIRTYLLAKLMWNVDADVDSLTRDFCQGYYGAAGKYMEQLMADMTQALVASGKHLDIYGYPINGADGYLAPDKMKHYYQLMEQAYKAVAGDSAVTDRLRYFELSLDFAQMELDMMRGVTDSRLSDRADRFQRDCHRFGIQWMMEMGVSVDEYRSQVERFVQKCGRPNLAQGKPVKMLREPDKRYPAGGAQGLTDGIAGIMNYNQNWLGFFGDTLTAVVDLQKPQMVRQISLDFYFYPLSWIFLPQQVQFFVSENGRDWQLVGEEQPLNPPILATPDIRSLSAKFTSRKARYVKVTAVPLETIPDWHRAAGNPCWIFTDELIVR